jgi:glutathione S-transferase
MILYDANAPGPNPVTVRLFILERTGIRLDVETIDLANLANRAKPYRTTVNARGEVPALRLDNGKIITEITAICGYLDEVAAGGRRLFGDTPEERAEIRMWTRRAYLEICHPFVTWWRGGEDAENLYRGNRILFPEARRSNRALAEAGLNQLDDDLEGKAFICGDAITMADIMLYGFMGSMIGIVPWLNPPGRTHVAAWFERMSHREAAQQMMTPFGARFEN